MDHNDTQDQQEARIYLHGVLDVSDIDTYAFASGHMSCPG